MHNVCFVEVVCTTHSYAGLVRASAAKVGTFCKLLRWKVHSRTNLWLGRVNLKLNENLHLQWYLV